MAGNETHREEKGSVEPVRVMVDAGICGFISAVEATGEGRSVTFSIQSDCEQIKKLAECLGPISLRDLFVPLSKNSIFLSAEKSRCHLACPVPWALVKAAEVVLKLALPKEATLRFLNTNP